MRHCGCSAKHVPKPLGLIEDNGIWLCPTALVNLNILIQEWERYGGEPPGSVTKHYGAFIRRLARDRMTVVG